MRGSSLSVVNYFLTKKFILLVSVLNMLDAVLTVYAVKFIGSVEGNPLMYWFMVETSMYGFIFLKLFISFFLLFAVSRLWVSWWSVGRWLRLGYLFGSIFCFVSYVAVVVHNLFVILL